MFKQAKWSLYRDRLLDPTIVASFSKGGFLRHSDYFENSHSDIDMLGKRVLITGANSGIGKATAMAMAKANATVVMLCRSVERGAAAKADIVAQTGSKTIQLIKLDVSSFSEIRTLSEKLIADPIDVLIHNAGVLGSAYSSNKKGVELTLATNLVGPHLMTQLCLPALTEGKIIWVSSGGMYPTKINLSQLEQPPKNSFDGVKAYSQTKRAQVILNELYSERYTSIKSYCMHPGWVDTPAVKSSIPRFYRLTKSILREPEQGADTIIWLAQATLAEESGGFFFDRKARKTHAFPWTKESLSQREELWSLCERLSQL